MVERQLCKLDVVGSTPISSTSETALDLESGGRRQEAASTKHIDNRIRRVRRASHSEVFARCRPLLGLDLDLDLASPEVTLGGSEFRVTKLLRVCGGCLGSRRR